MKLHLLTNKIAILTFSFFLFQNLLAQQRPDLELGLKLMAEANSNTGSTMPFSGIQLVLQKGKHSGFETGIYYRPVRNEIIVDFIDGSGNFYSAAVIIAERYLSLPVLYRFQSKIINFTAGPSFDLFLDWKDKSKSNLVSITDYNRSNLIEVGAVLSISKQINLSKKIVLEPEIRFNPIFTSGDPYAHTAFGFSIRYKL